MKIISVMVYLRKNLPCKSDTKTKVAIKSHASQRVPVLNQHNAYK